MKKVVFSAWVALTVAFVFVACEKAAGPDDRLTTSDQETIKSQIESDPLYTSDQMTLNDESAQTFGKTATPILPRGWGRRITSASRSYTFDQVNDELVIVTMKHTISGEIKIAAKYSVQDTITIISKPFTEETTRKIKFVPRVVANTTQGRWRPSEVSAVKGGSLNPQPILTFQEMIVYIGTDSLVITDPNEYYLKFPAFAGRQMPTFGLSTPMKVRLTLTSTESDTDMVFLHRPFMWLTASAFKPAMARMTMVSQSGSGPYTRVYEISWNSHIPGRHHFFVTGITRNSLFDDVAPWATQLWGVPYIVQ